MSEIDWSKWHQLKAPAPNAGEPKITMAASKRGLLTVGMNTAVLDALGIRERLVKDGQVPCHVFEGVGPDVGRLLVNWGVKEGHYKILSAFSGKVGRILQIRTNWDIDLSQNAEPVTFYHEQGTTHVQLEMPSWFNREMYRD